MVAKEPCLQQFTSDVSKEALPRKFTFPFYYDPHPLAITAAKELQEHLQTQTAWQHNFGLSTTQTEEGFGKMFGVLVVKNKEGKLGYLSAFSGKVADTNSLPKFVPPVFDMLSEDRFFQQEKVALNQLSKAIEAIENDPIFKELQQELTEKTAESTQDIAHEKARLQLAKKARKEQRTQGEKILSKEAQIKLLVRLKQESLHAKFYRTELQIDWQRRVAIIAVKEAVFSNKLNRLIAERKQKSAALQVHIMSQYQFLNAHGVAKELISLFENTTTQQPPAGAGECCAPKLLQYAYQQDFTPIAMAEFWWGKSPNSAIRKHGLFYPACQGKCKPILTHMLEGLRTDDNPMLQNPAIGKEITVLYEDDAMLVVHKPAEFLSVPGKEIQDSVYTRMKQQFPEATGPMIVHRLDMSTSGILLISKTAAANKALQKQFIQRTIQKRYLSVLEGNIAQDEGTITLPLRVDLEDRPRQLVCFEHGKNAETRYTVLSRENNQTRIHLFPITGRTHQLRVHAAHVLGLNCPIVGDDLYGSKKNRLHLQADWIVFKHPTTQKEMTFHVPAEF